MKERQGISPKSSVLAVIPHFRCEVWLERAVRSLLEQTRPPDAVAVIDDGSDEPPANIIRRFEGVTLLGSKANVGPYALVQRVIDATNFDAYMFQDADDWSAPDRLVRLLKGAERTGADLIGSYHVQVDEAGRELSRWRYPLDANAALLENPAGHVQLHPTTLVARKLVERVGGFATGLRFGADTEFIHRAHWVGNVLNLPRYLYFRTDRRDSLTNSARAGLASPARMKLVDSLNDRAKANADRVAGGERPDLRPMCVSDPVDLGHVWGPKLASRGPI